LKYHAAEAGGISPCSRTPYRLGFCIEVRSKLSGCIPVVATPGSVLRFVTDV
jgi:hypothetical protein